MPVFRIAKIPRGGAPEEVRRAWIGVSLLFDVPHGKSPERNLVTGEIQPARPLVTVPARIALAELAIKSPEAAEWFYDHLSQDLLQRGNFTFGIDELEITELKAGGI